MNRIKFKLMKINFLLEIAFQSKKYPIKDSITNYLNLKSLKEKS